MIGFYKTVLQVVAPAFCRLLCIKGKPAVFIHPHSLYTESFFSSHFLAIHRKENGEIF